MSSGEVLILHLREALPQGLSRALTEASLFKHLGGAGPRQVRFLNLDYIEARRASVCLPEARALAQREVLFGVGLWVPGEGTQHFTSAKHTEIPLHPYIASRRCSTNRQQILVSIMVQLAKRDRGVAISPC
jgi:hypothetical protein